MLAGAGKNSKRNDICWNEGEDNGGTPEPLVWPCRRSQVHTALSSCKSERQVLWLLGFPSLGIDWVKNCRLVGWGIHPGLPFPLPNPPKLLLLLERTARIPFTAPPAIFLAGSKCPQSGPGKVDCGNRAFPALLGAGNWGVLVKAKQTAFLWCRSAGIGTPEAIRLVWSCHREIINDYGPIPTDLSALKTT